jgi:lipoate-protein ligase A
MLRLDLPRLSPAEYLAADEALLDACEAGRGGETLLFWEPTETFVVAGYANKVATEVNVAACQERGLPIFRRCTGGGTVVQMPGGLNYSLLLRITENGPTRNISSANRFIMDKNCAAIQTALGPATWRVAVRGHTDLALAPRESPALPPVAFYKIAGNSQRRRRHFLLFHGTFLLQCRLNLIDELLPLPSQQPDYRAGRPHGKFVTNLNLPADAVKDALVRAWNADEKLVELPLEEIEKLAREKYLTRDWNYKF